MTAMLGVRSRYLTCATLGLLVLSSQGFGQTAEVSLAKSGVVQGEFVNRVFTDDSGDHKYVVFVPANYAANKKTPVIVYLHGASNRGTDGRSQLVSGLAPAIRLRMADFPFLVVFPQCENTQSRVLGGWTDQPEESERVLKILDSVERDYSVDTNHECLVGMSMGGAGVWDIAAKSATRWSALVPVSAMANQDDARKVAGIPAWVFHASSDPLVATPVARGMVTAVNNAGGRAYFSEVTKRVHDLSNVVFTQAALTDWLLDPSQTPNLDLAWEEPKGYSNGHDVEVPFVPGAEMERAVRMRICKDVLEAICFAAPEKLAAHPLAGHVGGVYQSATVGGFLPIDVSLSGMYYNGAVEQIRIIPKAPNRLILQAGLRNLTMTVSNSQLNGKLLFSATAGPMNVVIGHRAPVWMTVELHPYVANRRVFLNPVGMNFQIPPDNWYVTQPSEVHVRGLPFLNGRVSDGLVEGISSRKAEIEQRVMNGITPMIQNLEAKLNDQILSKTVAVGQIAMPIWQPRMRTFPEEVIVDDDGFTIISTVQLCTLGHVAKDFKMRRYPAMTEFPQPIKTGMEIDIAETVVPGWSELIVAGKVNRFNVRDFSPAEYHRLADRDFLQQVIPDLKKFGDDLETSVDFVLRDPIHLLDPPQDNAPKLLDVPAGNSLTLSLSSVPLHVSMRKKGETKWSLVGELDLHIDRDYVPYVKKADFVRRGPKFCERSSFRIQSKWTFSPDYEAEDLQVDEATFTAGVLKAREAAQLLEGVKPDAVHDIALNGVPLRMDEMDWVKKHLVIQYQLPGMLVANDSEEPLTYEVCGPHTPWSQPRTLAPGDYDLFRTTYPLTWRRRHGNQAQFYLLRLGHEFSFHTDPKPEMVRVEVEHGLEEERVVRQ